ncbi:MFS transporter, partial [Burkholderia sp. SIMBA_051]
LYGIVISVGVGGASNVAATVVVTNWFNEKRGLAFGIMEAGFGAGQMLLVPGSLILIQWFN